MKGLLITSDDCSPCEEMKKQFADLIKSGEIVEKNFEQDPDSVTELIQKHAASIPSLLIVTDDGELLVALNNEAKPPAA